MQNFMEFDMIKYLDLKTVYIWGLGPKTSLGQIETKAFGKDISRCKSRTIAPVFTNRTSFFPES